MTVEITQRAKSEINRIYSYISNVIGMPGTALNTVDDIIAAIDDLIIFPKRHKPWKDSGYRFFSVKNYTIFYRIDEAAEKIYVEKIIYSRRDIDALL